MLKSVMIYNNRHSSICFSQESKSIDFTYNNMFILNIVSYYIICK